MTDLPRAERFYADGLGFAREATLQVEGEPTETLIGLKDVDLRAVYLVRDGVRIELLHYARPGVEPGPRPRPLNQLGLTHLSLRVENLEGTLAALEQLGAEVLRDSQIGVPERDAGAVFVLDPDGLRIELVASPGDPTRPPGGADPA